MALVGADGAGKSTVARELVQHLGLPAHYLYMGVNLETSRVVLPTTWLLLTLKRSKGGRPDLSPHGPGDGSAQVALGSSLRDGLKQSLRIANLVAEEWFRQVLVWRRHSRGEIVVCDRHFYADYRAHDIVDRSHKRLPIRVHGYLLDRWYPRPDVVIALEAPAAALLARKGEGTLESLQRRQEEYRLLRDEVDHFVTLDATRPLGEVVRAAARVVTQYASRR